MTAEIRLSFRRMHFADANINVHFPNGGGEKYNS